MGRGTDLLGSGLVVVGSSLECDAAVKEVYGAGRFVELLQQVEIARGGGRVPLRFCDVSSLHLTPIGIVDKDVVGAVSRAGTEEAAVVERDKFCLPSLDALQDQIRKLPASAEAGFFDQPVCFMFATLISDREAVTSLSVLADGTSSTLPDVYREGILDASEAIRSYVLLSKAGESKASVNRALSSTRAAFGARNVYLVNLDPVMLDGDVIEENYQPLAQPVVNSLVEEMASQIVPSFLRTKASDLGAYVERVRKGVRNTFKALFRAPDKHRPGVIYKEGPNGPPTFLASAIESHVRLLADTLFLLGDYEQAGLHYRIVASDYKLMKANIPQGAALEVTSLCVRLTNGPPREAADCLSGAIDAYIRAEDWLLALRATLELIRFCLSLSAFESASRAALKTIDALPVVPHTKVNDGALAPGGLTFEVASGVLFELAAMCYQLAVPLPKTRKALLYSFLSGEKYSSAGLHHLAAKRFRVCLERVEGKHWHRLSDNLHFLLAGEESRLNELENAYTHLSRLLKASDSPTASQLRVMNGLFSLVQKWRATENTRQPPTLPFPCLVEDMTMIGTVDGPLQDVDEGKHWQNVEEVVLEEAIQGDRRRETQRRRNIFRPRHKKDKTQRYAVPGPSVVGEDVVLRVGISNPMRVPIFLYNLRAVASIHNSKDVEEKNGWADGMEGAERGAGGGLGEDNDVEAVPMASLMLQPLSTAKLDLIVRPKRSGFLRFHHVDWTFSHEASGDVRCRGEGSLGRRGRRLNFTKAQKTSETPLYAPDRSMTVQVLDKLPRLSVRLLTPTHLAPGVDHGSPETLMLREGEMVRNELHLENCGTEDIGQVYGAFNLRESVYFDPMDHEDFHVDAGGEKRLALWLRGSALGGPAHHSATGRDLVLRGVFCHACPVGKDEVMLRLTRVSVRLHISPCISAFPRFLRHNKVKTVREYLLGVEVEHGDSVPTEVYRVRSLSVYSKGVWLSYGLPPLVFPEQSDDEEHPSESVILYANETATLFILLRKAPQNSNEENGDTSPHEFPPVRVPFGDLSDEKPEEDGDVRHRASMFFMQNEHTRAHTEDIAESPEVAKVVLHWTEQTSGAKGEVYLPPLVPSQWVDDEEKSRSGRATQQGDCGRQYDHLPQEHDPPVLELCCIHTPEVEVDLEGKRLPCTLPVDIIVRNTGALERVIDAHFSAVPASIADRSRGRYAKQTTKA